MKRAYLVSFGLGGHMVVTKEATRRGRHDSGHIAGYDSPESFEVALTRGEKADYPPLAGIPVLDKRGALRKSPAIALGSPLVDVNLEADAVDRFDQDAARSMLPGLSGGFKTLAQLGASHEEAAPGPLDAVSLPAYIAWWVERGARLGRMDEAGLRIVWKDEKEPA